MYLIFIAWGIHRYLNLSVLKALVGGSLILGVELLINDTHVLFPLLSTYSSIFCIVWQAAISAMHVIFTNIKLVTMNNGFDDIQHCVND